MGGRGKVGERGERESTVNRGEKTFAVVAIIRREKADGHPSWRQQRALSAGGRFSDSR
jgi:hypothetical protein